MPKHAQKKREKKDPEPVLDKAAEEAVLRAAALRAQRRTAVTSVPQQYLGDLVLGRLKIEWPKLPGDAIYLGSYLHQAANVVSIIWGHESFPEVPVGMVLPDLGLGSVITLVEEPGDG